MTKRSWRAVLVGVAALSLVAAACSSDSGSGGGSDAGAEVDPSATFHYGYNSVLTRWDPMKSGASQDSVWYFPVFDRLIHTDPEANLIPGLATEWSFNPAATQLTLKLRDGVTFSDGTPFDAAAVKANVERLKTLQGGTLAADLASVSTVTVVDAHTARLDLSTPDAALPGILSDRAGMMISPATFSGDVDAHPVGAGAYTLVSYTKGDRAVYKARAGYWDPDSVKVAGLEILEIVPNPSRLSALQAGQIDAAEVLPSDVPVAENAGLDLQMKTTLITAYAHFNHSHKPFDDERVRKAINLATNRDRMVQNTLSGLGDAVQQMFPPDYAAFNPDVQPTYDPAEAKRLLAAAGYANGFTFEVVVGTVTTPQVQSFQEDMRQIGVTANIRIVDAAQIAPYFYQQKQGDMIFGDWGGRPTPYQTLNQIYGTGFINPSGFTTPEVTSLLKQSEATVDDGAREEIYQQINAAAADASLSTPLYSRQFIVAAQKDVTGLNIYRVGKIELRGMAITK